MKLIIIGGPGSGKGTQAKFLSKKLSIPHISTGDILREVKGESRKKIDSYVAKGNLFPDELMFEILKKRLEKEDCKNGFILDGFPRTIPQVDLLDSFTNIDHAIEIIVSEEEIIKRLSGRRTCEKCGGIFNIYTFPKPKQENICDTCGEKLHERDDQAPEAIKTRIKVYHKQTKPILERYNTIKINGEQEIEEVTKNILEKLLV